VLSWLITRWSMAKNRERGAGPSRTGTLNAAPKVQLFERNRGNAGNNARELQGLENIESNPSPVRVGWGNLDTKPTFHGVLQSSDYRVAELVICICRNQNLHSTEFEFLCFFMLIIYGQ